MSQKYVNIHIYKGLDRNSATTPLIRNNLHPNLNENYSVPLDSGILIIAIPAANTYDTDLKFEYWIDEKEYTTGPE